VTAPGKFVGPAYTDMAGEPASRLQLERLLNRYLWASGYCAGALTLEVACGSGQGLGLLARTARTAIGGDYSAENIRVARRTYGGRVPLLRLDALSLPIADGSLDVLIMLETLYFLPSPEAFATEAARVLRPGGRFLVSVINKDCWDFNPSSMYSRHFGAPGTAQLLRSAGFDVTCFGAIPMDRPTMRQQLFGPIKRVAVSLGMIPKTMQGRVWLKRIVFGPLRPIPFELAPETAPYRPPTPLPSDHPDTRHQVVLCLGRLPDAR
jgi:SAM-dependent methyltransferase